MEMLTTRAADVAHAAPTVAEQRQAQQLQRQRQQHEADQYQQQQYPTALTSQSSSRRVSVALPIAAASTMASSVSPLHSNRFSSSFFTPSHPAQHEDNTFLTAASPRYFNRHSSTINRFSHLVSSPLPPALPSSVSLAASTPRHMGHDSTLTTPRTLQTLRSSRLLIPPASSTAVPSPFITEDDGSATLRKRRGINPELAALVRLIFLGIF